ncbi:MAG: hypothetical protein LBK08_05885 [Treponema sp.]|jgi:hypothetical protein|nr:hypothetical protein [Treponema sp.]
MKHDRQIGIRVGLPAMFCLELEDVYKNAAGPHRGIAFADWCGLLLGYGLEAYRIKHIRQDEQTPEDSGAADDRGTWDAEPERGVRRALAGEEN